MNAGVDRESVECSQCGAQPSEACEFVDGPAPIVDDNGIKRRGVHAARYAASLPPEERGQFWATAVESYLAKELWLMAEAENAAIARGGDEASRG